ncbi:hypothetical protein MMC30_006390 [Trapelia coarctata]|nr:hypothetical protein [Trapelia coarctata]
MFTCSVDASWAFGNNVALNVINPWAVFALEGDFLPINDGTWRTIRLSPDWLNTLTPVFDYETPEWTSLASLMLGMGVDNSSGMIRSWGDLQSPIEGALATVVAEGISRTGFAANSGQANMFSQYHTPPRWLLDDTGPRIILAGNGNAFLPLVNTGPNNVTQLYWSVTFKGYAYKADSTAYFLALSVLFTHSALALGHNVYVLCTRCSSDTWESFEEMLVLSHSAAPAPEKMKDTSADIRHNGTMRKVAKIRVIKDEKATVGQEALQLLFDHDPKDNRFERVMVNESYGAVS